MRAIILTLSASAILAAPAAAQDDPRVRLREAFPADALSRIEQVLADAEAAGLPAAPLLDKALEGAAKGVPPDRVVAALDAYSGRLARAGAALGPERSPGELVAGADAMRRGVPENTLGALARDHAGDLSVPLVVLGDLMDAGVPVTRAYDVVRIAMERGSPPDRMLGIPGAVRRLIREGRLPDQAASAVARAFERGPPGAGMRNGPPVPPGAGPPDGRGPPDRKGPPDGQGPPGGPPGGS